MEIKHHPADMNTAEHYEVIDGDKACIVWVSRILQFKAMRCTCCGQYEHNPCEHINAITNAGN